jgi:GDP-L-fucose synthase
MKVFVAGSAGMVGSSVIRNAPNGLNLVTASRDELNITDLIEVKHFLQQNEIDSVILAAARVGGIHANSKYGIDFLLDNLKIQNAVIEAAHLSGVKNFAFLGSSCIYPKMAAQPLKEVAMLSGYLEETNEPYAIAKIAGIKLIELIAKESGLNYFSLMPSNLYGIGDNFDLMNSHVPAALMRKMHEAKINKISTQEIWGTGKAQREFLHVDDLSSAIWFFLKDRSAPGALINIGTGTDITIHAFAVLMAKIVGYEGELIFNAGKPDGTPKKVLDVTKANALGWHSTIELEPGLRDTYDWFVNAYGRGEIRGF